MEPNRVEIEFSDYALDAPSLREILQQEPNAIRVKIGARTELEDPNAVIHVLQTFRQLESLTFDSLDSVNDGDAVAESIGRLFRFRSNLKRLAFEGCLTDAGFTHIGKVLQQYPQSPLEVLEIDDLPTVHGLENRSIVLSREAATSLAKGLEENTSLKEVMINVTRIPADETALLVEALVNNQSVTDVHLCGMEANGKVWSALAKVLEENKTLTTLGLRCSCSYRGATIDPQDFRSFAAALASNKTIKRIILDHFDFDAATLKTIVDALLENDTIGHVIYRQNQLNTDKMEQLCRLVANRETMFLGLTHNAIGDDPRLVEMLCKALRQSSGLHCLNLAFNDIEDEGAEMLANLLRTNPELDHLHMGFHRITDKGCKSFGKALETNTTLKVLSLTTSCGCTSDPLTSIQGIQALVNGMKNNLELTQLDLPSPCLWPTRITNELDVYLARNKVISPLLKANLPLGLWPHVMERASRCLKAGNTATPDMLFAVVKEKCDLFQNVLPTRSRKRRRTRR